MMQILSHLLRDTEILSGTKRICGYPYVDMWILLGSTYPLDYTYLDLFHMFIWKGEDPLKTEKVIGSTFCL